MSSPAPTPASACVASTPDLKRTSGGACCSVSGRFDVRAEQRDCGLGDLRERRAHHSNEVERRLLAEQRHAGVERGEHRFVATPRRCARLSGRAARRQARGERDLLRSARPTRRPVPRIPWCRPAGPGTASVSSSRARRRRLRGWRSRPQRASPTSSSCSRDAPPVLGVGRRGVEQPRRFDLFEHGTRLRPLCETAIVGDVPSTQPSGLVTFLFTDVEGSTRLWAAHTAVMEPALGPPRRPPARGHRRRGRLRLLDRRRQLRRRVRVPRRPRSAAAVRAQIALHAEQWDGTPRRAARPDGPAPRNDAGARRQLLRSRREPRRRASCRRRGAARSCAPAAIAERVAAPMPPLGRAPPARRRRHGHAPPGLAPGVPEDFPPPRTLDATPTTLPAQRSSFVGRGPDVATVRRLLFDHRLVTLTGPGGTGKTRLAIEIAGREQPHHPGGTFFADLASLEDGDHLAATVARACLDLARREPADRRSADRRARVAQRARRTRQLRARARCGRRGRGPRARLVSRRRAARDEPRAARTRG